MALKEQPDTEDKFQGSRFEDVYPTTRGQCYDFLPLEMCLKGLQLSSSMIISPSCTPVYTTLRMQSYVSPSWYVLVEGNIYFHLPTHHLYTGVPQGDLDLDLLGSCDRVGH